MRRAPTLESGLWALREKIDATGLAQLRTTSDPTTEPEPICLQFRALEHPKLRTKAQHSRSDTRRP